MRRRHGAAAVLIAGLVVVGSPPSRAAPPSKGTLSVTITSAPSNPTTSTEAVFAFAVGGSATSTECQESPGVGDRFQRLGGLGSADTGGSWIASSAFSTDGQRARVTAAAAETRLATLDNATSDSDVSARVSFSGLPIGDTVSAVIASRATATSYTGARLLLQPGGQIRLQVVSSPLTSVETVIGSAGVGPKYKAGQVLWLRFQTLGTTTRAKAWAEGKVEPDWQVTVADTTPVAGTAVGFGVSGGPALSNQVDVSVNDLSATDPNAAATVAPCGGGSASYSGLALGGHVFQVRVSVASSEAIAIYPWTILPPPPGVELTATPPDPVNDPSATFAWTTSGIVDFTTCTLDGVSAPCASPTTYTGLTIGAHEFEVMVGNAGGSSTASYSWSIEYELIPIGVLNPPAPATSQSEQPTAFSTSIPNAAVLDCDPNLPNLGAEVVDGCGLAYAPNSMQSDPVCPGTAGFFSLPKPPPFDDWPPFTCVLTQTTAATNQLVQGFNLRTFGVATNPTCPAEQAGFVSGRNYWSDANNADDTWAFPNLYIGDPRIARLTVLPSAAFSGTGNETHPIEAIVRLYITGWGIVLGNGSVVVEDPCEGANPPSGFPPVASGFYFWGHVIP